MRKTIFLLSLLSVVSSLGFSAIKSDGRRLANVEPILLLVDTPAANLVYKKTSEALDVLGRLTEEAIALNSKSQSPHIYVHFAVIPELGLFFFEHDLGNKTCCALIFGKDAKKTMEKYAADPRFLSDKRDKELREAAVEYLEAAPGRSLNDPEWQQESARLEAIFRAYVETEVRPLYQRANIIDVGAADGSEIVLFGGPKLCAYCKVANVETLRDFMANARALTEMAITELKVNGRCSKSTLKWLDTLATLTPEKYGMSK